MKTITKSLIFILLMSVIVLPAKSQDENEYNDRIFQLTLFPPIGTNGPDGRNCVNQLSLNILWGESAGLRGIELGGILNRELDFVKGVQFAGVANLVTGDVTGLQFTHVINVAGGNVTGGQFSGFMNISHDVTGVQSSGFMNIAGSVTGAQASGFLNIAGNVKGSQIGFINIAENYEEGVPIGFINIVKQGYHDFEISGSEIWNLNLGYRLGVDRLYTQFMLGSRWERDEPFWGFGFGLGTRFHITRYFTGAIDLTSYQLIRQGHLYEHHPNLLEQARITLEGKILGDLKWFIGPTFNIMVLPYEYPEPAFLDHLDSWTIYENASGISYVKMWPGISGGIRF
jgi:hypothetical protein